MSNTNALELIEDRGWRSGFRNMLRKENSLWWGTRKWWIQSLVWMVILNGLLVMVLIISPVIDPENATIPTEYVKPFLRIFGGLTTFGVIVLMMDTIVEEKRSGTAAWIMSNPVSRSSFILSKLIANVIGIFVIVIGLQGLLAYVIFSVKGGIEYGAMAFFGGMLLNTLHALFYITLAIMLGCLFNSRGPVIGISLVIMAGQDFLEQLIGQHTSWLPSLLPNRLVEMAGSFSVDQGLEYPIAIFSTGVLSMLFIGVGLWKFKREEL